MDLTTSYQIAGIISSFCALLTVLILVMGKMAKRYSDQIVNRIVTDYLSELKPNGGSSLKDSIRRIESSVNEVKVDLSRLEGQFQQHIVENN